MGIFIYPRISQLPLFSAYIGLKLLCSRTQYSINRPSNIPKSLLKIETLNRAKIYRIWPFHACSCFSCRGRSRNVFAVLILFLLRATKQKFAFIKENKHFQAIKWSNYIKNEIICKFEIILGRREIETLAHISSSIYSKHFI